MKSVKQITKRAFSPITGKVPIHFPRHSKLPNARRNLILTTLIIHTAPANNSTHMQTRIRKEMLILLKISSPAMSQSINIASLLNQSMIGLLILLALLFFPLEAEPKLIMSNQGPKLGKSLLRKGTLNISVSIVNGKNAYIQPSRRN